MRYRIIGGWCARPLNAAARVLPRLAVMPVMGLPGRSRLTVGPVVGRGLRVMPRLAAVLAVVGGMMLSSCLDDDDEKYELSSDCYISNITLGNMRRLVTVTASDGSDSIARQSYTASGFAFRIDQLNRLIYNPEYLPHNVQLDAALLNITANGAVAWRKRSTNPQEEVNNEDWHAYSSTDSVDVRDTIILRVYSYDGTQQRDYRLKVNRYDRDPDSLYWRKAATCPLLGDFTMHRSMMRDGELCVVGRDAEGTTSLVRPLAEAPAKEAYDGDYDPALTGIAEIDRLAGQVTADREFLPTLYVTGASIYAGSTPRHVLAGVLEGDELAAVWIGSTSGLYHCTPNNAEQYALPALKHLQVTSYKGRLAAFGGEQTCGSERTALGTVYVSKDYGVTWNPNTKWATPKDLRGRTQPLSAVGTDSVMYVVSGDEVWEAR